MPRYIDADALEKRLEHLWNISDDSDFANKEVWHALSEAPTIDVPDRKAGEWIVIMDEPTITFDECKCSECGVVEYFNKGWKKFNYCPSCGAKMKGEGDEPDRDQKALPG